MNQTTNIVAIVKPTYFDVPSIGTQDNYFSNHVTEYNIDDINDEFQNLKNCLTKKNIMHIVYESPIGTPNAVFPNNWVTIHWETKEPIMVLYPMKSINRRKERKSIIISDLLLNSKIPLKLYDLTYFEQTNNFLEGTGSMVLDRINKIAYCCLSQRTHQVVIDVWKRLLGYQTCIFQAYDEQERPIYHTNVMMSLGETFAIICLSSIKNKKDRKRVIDCLSLKSKKLIIPITMKQLNNFVGNCLQVKNIYGNHVMCLSKTAYESLSYNQKKLINKACSGGIAIINY